MICPGPNLIKPNHHLMIRWSWPHCEWSKIFKWPFNEPRIEKRSDLHRVIKLVNELGATFSFFGLKGRILEHSKTLIFHPRKTSGRMRQLVELEPLVFREPVPSTRDQRGTKSMETPSTGKGSQRRDWFFTSWCRISSLLPELLVTLKDKKS